MPDDQGQWPVALTIEDASRRITEARAATPDEMRAMADTTPWEGAAGGIHELPNMDGKFMVAWAGSACHRVVHVSISAALDRITIARDPVGECELAATYRGIVLDAQPPVSAEAIALDLP